jgi:hypothetical protein
MTHLKNYYETSYRKDIDESREKGKRKRVI